MAEKRMFSRELVESDDFLDLPLSAQALYIHICMEADDDGFVNNANRIRRVVGATQEDYQTLFDRGYLIQMSNGLVVVAHWRICNTIRKDRRKPTVYQSEYKKLKICDNVYTLDSKGEKQAQPVTSIPQEKTVQKFEEFWKAYPRKKGKEDARKAWKKLAPDLDTCRRMAAALESQKKSHDWVKERGRFVPYPATWLNGRRWEDEPDELPVNRESRLEEQEGVEYF